MIPILFEKTEVNFDTYGIGALSDVTSCVCTEERNGQYECIFTYPITGVRYEEIQAERIVKAKAKPLGDDQLFRIYRMTKPIHGIVTVYAQHISYDLSGVAVTPFSASLGPEQAMTRLFTGTSFIAHSDKSGSKTFGPDVPQSVRAMLGGTSGSVLQLWGGEYKWDNFDVYLQTNRGLDKNVVIEYGKNLTDLVADNDLSEVYSQLLPYATYMDEDGNRQTVTGDPVPITSVITRTKTLVKDFSFDFDGQMTPAQVTAKGQEYVRENPLGYETPSLTVAFVNLQHDAPYPAAAATVDLCDTVTIRYTALGVDVKAKIVKAEYDTLNERYTRLTIGTPRANMADTVANLTDVTKIVVDYPQMWQSAIAEATAMITGNNGGHVVLHEGPDGKPFELLVMDDEDITQATKVWRWTQGGLGYSTNGYAGPYELAITADGKINADFIRTGRLLVEDADHNVLFEADTDTDQVQIAGFDVEDNKLSITKSVPNTQFPGYNDRFTTYITNYQFQAFKTSYRKSSNNTIYSYSTYENIGADELTLVDNDGQNPDAPGNFRQAIIQPGVLFAQGDYGVVNVDTIGDATPYGFDSPMIALEGDNGKTVYISGGSASIGLDDGTYTKTISAAGPIPSTGYGSRSVASDTNYHTIGEIQISNGGTYMVFAHAAFASNNGTGRRGLLLSYSQNSSTAIASRFVINQRAVDGTYTNMILCGVLSLSSPTKYYINAQQNSGSSMTVNYSYSYVRLA